MSSGKPEGIFEYLKKRFSMKQIKVEEISYRYPIGEEEEEGQASAGKAAKTPEAAADNAPKALDGVSLEVEKGQFICILGSNGSGKSTLARHLNALLVPEEGTVWIGGMDTRNDEHLWDIRSRVGMVFQNPDNQMVASQVDEEIAFGPENIGIPSEEILLRVKEALEYVGMAGYEKNNPNYLSGGQKQRVAVAGILAMKPECIVLDESTAMLDPKGRKEIMETVLDLNKKHGITIICITHYMEEAVQADRIFVMNEGKVLLSGRPEEIFSRTDKLRQADLKLPVICRIAEELRKRGMQIPADVITKDRLVSLIRSTARS